MPVMGGLETTQKIRELEATSGVKTPIIGCSGNARPEQKSEAMKRGINEYLTKPYHREEIYRMIDENLNLEAPPLKKNRKNTLR